MRTLLLITVFLCLVGYSSGIFNLLLKNKNLQRKRENNLLNGILCKNLGPPTKKNFLRYLICNRTALFDECKDKGEEFYYASSRENVSRAIRTASKLFPDFHAVVTAAENVSYPMFECYRNAFYNLSEQVQNETLDPQKFWDSWVEVCPEYQEIAEGIIRVMNETGFPESDIFFYTYDNLPPFANNSFNMILNNIRRVWNYKTWNWYEIDPDDSVSRVPFYQPYNLFCAYPKAWSNTDNETIGESMKFMKPLLRYNDHYGEWSDNYENYCHYITRWLFFYANNRGDPLTEEEYQSLTAYNLLFEKYVHENAVHFYNEMVTKLVENQEADDTSDPIIVKVAEIVADWVSNATGRGDDSQSGGSGGPTDEFIKKFCDFINDATKALPALPGSRSPNSFAKIAMSVKNMADHDFTCAANKGKGPKCKDYREHLNGNGNNGNGNGNGNGNNGNGNGNNGNGNGNGNGNNGNGNGNGNGNNGNGNGNGNGNDGNGNGNGNGNNGNGNGNGNNVGNKIKDALDNWKNNDKVKEASNKIKEALGKFGK